MNHNEPTPPFDAPAVQMPLQDWVSSFEFGGREFTVEQYYRTVGEAMSAMEQHSDRMFVLIQLSHKPTAPYRYLFRHAEFVNGDQIKNAVFTVRYCESHGVCSEGKIGLDVTALLGVGLLNGVVQKYQDPIELDRLTGQCVVMECEGGIVHGTLRDQLDPVVVDAPDHDLYGVQCGTVPIPFIHIERVTLCPVVNPVPSQ